MKQKLSAVLLFLFSIVLMACGSSSQQSSSQLSSSSGGTASLAASSAISSLTSSSSSSTPRLNEFYDDFRAGIDESRWGLRSGSNGSPFGCAFSPELISVGAEGASLTLQPGSCAELRTQDFYGYGRYETAMRVGDGLGTVSSLFTYTSGWDVAGRAWQEIDIEFLPSFGNVIHTNVIYQAEGKALLSWEKDIDLTPYGLDITQDTIQVGFVWGPEQIQWYVYDGIGNQHVLRVVEKVTSNLEGVDQIPAYAWPTDHARLMINHWHGDNSELSSYFPKHYTQNTSQASYKYVSYFAEY